MQRREIQPRMFFILKSLFLCNWYKDGKIGGKPPTGVNEGLGWGKFSFPPVEERSLERGFSHFPNGELSI